MRISDWSSYVCSSDRGLPEQPEPDLEMLGPHALQAKVRSQGAALVAAARQHHGGPEVAHLRQMLVPPVADDAVEAGPERCVGANPIIEGEHAFVRQRLADVRVRAAPEQVLRLGRGAGRGE